MVSGAEHRPKDYRMVTDELAETGKGQTTLTLIQGNSPTQRDANSAAHYSITAR